MRVILLFLFSNLFLGFSGFASAKMPKILPLKEQAQVIDRLLEEKIETMLPELMRKTTLTCGL